jgi:hypothetical protein
MRILAAEPGTGTGATELSGSIVNLSCSGACVTLPRPIDSSDVIEMQFSLPERELPVKVYAEMVWAENSNNAQATVGFHFLAIRDSDALLIKKMEQGMKAIPHFAPSVG